MSNHKFGEIIEVKKISVFFEFFGNCEDFVIIDLRGKKDFVAGAIPKAINMDFDEFDNKFILKKFKKEKTYLLYCEKTIKSRVVSEMFRDAEFTKVHYLEYGYKGWMKATGKL